MSNFIAQKAVLVGIILASLMVPVLMFVMLFAAIEKYRDVVCTVTNAVNAVFGTDYLALLCEPIGGGGGGTSGGFLSSNCGGSTQALTIKTDYLNWTNDAANLYLKDETNKYFPDGQPVAILAALINLESGWNSTAHNSSGATGLGQFLYSTAVGRPEFNGGSALKTFPKGTLYSQKTIPPNDDARFDAERSIYATANYFKSTINNTKGSCSSQSGMARFTCAYIYSYNGGCDPSIADKIPSWSHGKTYCQVAKEAADLMTQYYQQYVGGGTGANCSSVKLAEQTAQDVKDLDGGPKNQDMTIKKSAYSQGRSWCDRVGKFPYYADCGSFVGYVMRNTNDPSFPASGTYLQFNYVDSGKGKDKYDVIPVNGTDDLMPGDILAYGSCNSENECQAGEHTAIYVGNGKIVAASRCGYAPTLKDYYHTFKVAYRLKQ